MNSEVPHGSLAVQRGAPWLWQYSEAGVYISWKALTKWLGKVKGIFGNLEASSPLHFNLLKYGSGVDVSGAGLTK